MDGGSVLLKQHWQVQTKTKPPADAEQLIKNNVLFASNAQKGAQPFL